jgi:hypothetical protein
MRFARLRETGKWLRYSSYHWLLEWEGFRWGKVLRVDQRLAIEGTWKCSGWAITTAVAKKSQVLGCLSGGALGDAWAGPWEGATGPVDFQILSQSYLSDDTQLTLATCESIIENGGVNTERLAAHFAT